MRVLPPLIAAATAPGAVGTLATVWILTRLDGSMLGFTDHDRPLSLHGVPCAPQTGLTAGAARTELGPRPGDAEVQGLLDDAALTETDIAAGLYDRARVTAFRVDWTAPEASALVLWRGRIAGLERAGSGYVAHVAGPLAELGTVTGRTYQRRCDAVLGDTRCRVDLTLALYRAATCDKAWTTCRDRFGNLINFQGFPDLPGDDYLAVYAADSPANTGGSRRT
jgi:hypothetical protein